MSTVETLTIYVEKRKTKHPFQIDGINTNSAGQKETTRLFAKTRSHTLKCKGPRCEGFLVLHLSSVHHARYVFNVTLEGLKSSHFGVEEIAFTVTTFNPEFTRMELWFRLGKNVSFSTVPMIKTAKDF